MFSLQVNNLHKRFGTTKVLTGLTFSHGNGILGIEGSNGSGKSTLLKCLAGLLNPTSGTIHWRRGESSLSASDFKSCLGYVAPYINLYPELTVWENIELVLQLRKQPTQKTLSEKLQGRLQLHGLRDKPFGDLSTGQQQRARLACTLSYGPSILFLDEPGANLDEEGRNSIREILNDFRKKEKLVLLASNNPTELDLADKVYSVE